MPDHRLSPGRPGPARRDDRRPAFGQASSQGAQAVLLVGPGYDAAPTVESDLENGMAQILGHLRESGATRVALLSGPEPDAYPQDSERLYREWCAETGQTPLGE